VSFRRTTIWSPPKGPKFCGFFITVNGEFSST
jgi:hypothetical protein